MNQPKWNDLKAKFIKPGRPKIVGIVLHDTAGSASKYGVGHNDTRYLANPGDGRRVSVDFTVERDGSIWKLNPDLSKFYCLHAGRATAFKGLRNGGVTRSTIGIEICQPAAQSEVRYPVEQVKSVATLCAWLTEQFKLTPSDITTHRNIITDGSRSDPRQFPFEGPNGFWKYFWEAKGKGPEYDASCKIRKTPDITKDQRTHTVAAGDTLFGIAKKYYGKGDLYPLIDKANDLKNGLILPGQVLIIPEATKGKEPEYDAGRATTKKPDITKPERTHTVKADDTLFGIAKKYYGKGNLYPLIEKANALKNGLIVPGQVLKIPDQK